MYPEEVDGRPAQGPFRSHQVPLAQVRANPSTWLTAQESWLRSCRPVDLFNDNHGDQVPDRYHRAGPAGELRMSAHPHAKGESMTRDL